MDVNVLERDDELVVLLRRTLETKAAELAVEPGGLRPSPRQPNRPHRAMVAAAAAVVAAGGVGTYVALRGESTEPAAVSAPADDTSDRPPPTQAETQVQWYLPSVVPPGYQLTEIHATTVEDRGHAASGQYVTITLEALDGERFPVQINIAPLGAYERDLTDERRTVVDGVEYLVAVRPAVGGFPEHRTATAERGGQMLLVSGPLSTDELVDVAAGVQPASRQQAAAAQRAVTTHALALPLRARLTLPDGIVVSARDTPNGWVALCVEEPVLECRRDTSGIAFDGAPTSRVEEFAVGGQRHLVGWYGGDAVDCGDGLPVIVLAADEGTGRFVHAELTEELLNLEPMPEPAPGTADCIGGRRFVYSRAIVAPGRELVRP